VWSVKAVKLSQRGRLPRWHCGRTTDKNMSKCASKHHFFRVTSEVKKDLKDIFAGIDICKK
jgi:hypothetical protein